MIPFSRDSVSGTGPRSRRSTEVQGAIALGPGRNLRRIREAQGLSVDALAATARFAPEEIVCIEAGAEPELETLWALALALDVAFLELVKAED